MIENDLRAYLEDGDNVLLIGDHGVGKTTIVTELFEEAGLTWRYFSAATMDPWVDFIGIPKETTDSEGNPYLQLVKPEGFHNDSIEALFFDEYNRAHKKVRNAVMELIQFKSINGVRFNNLKVVWAAINPHDTEQAYDVEPLDPAQLDRFHVHYFMDNIPSLPYFTRKYGELGVRAVTWWGKRTQEIKKLVSPRRLDYAVAAYQRNRDLRHYLPKGVNVSEFTHDLGSRPVLTVLGEMYNTYQERSKQAGRREAYNTEIYKWFKVENNYTAAVDILKKNNTLRPFFIKYFTPEQIATCLSTWTSPELYDIVDAGSTNEKIRQAVISYVLTASDSPNGVAIIHRIEGMPSLHTPYSSLVQALTERINLTSKKSSQVDNLLKMFEQHIIDLGDPF